MEDLRRERDQLRAEREADRALIAQLLQELARLTERVAELTAAVGRKRRGSTASAPSSPAKVEPSPLLTPAQAKEFEERPVAPPKPPGRERSERAPQSRPGRKPLPNTLPVEAHELRVEACAACGGTELDVVDTLVEEKLHVVEAHQRRRRVTRTTCRCRRCGERSTPRSLGAPFARSKVTSAWLAWMVHQKFSMIVPLDRLRRDLAAQGISLAMANLVRYVERAADALAPIDGEHWKQVLAGRWLATDATGLKVLVKGLPEAHDGYIELYRNSDVAVFQYEATKHGESLASKLAPFRGTITADAEHRMNRVFHEGVLEAGCNAHGRRKFRDAEATQPVLAVEGGRFLGAMYGKEEDARKRGLTGAQLLEHRKVQIAPIVEDFDRWRRATLPGLLPKDPLAIAIRYYDNHRAALFRFLEDPDVPIDNSATEREFQHVAKLRLAALFAGSTEGAHRACILLGVAATCRALNVHFERYLEWLFERRGTNEDLYMLPAKALTPAAYKASLR